MIIIAVDVEAWELSHNTITEIGIATLDTRDIANLAPGPNGHNWHTQIRARHFRISEYAHLKNHKFVTGCPESFDFGTSEFIPRAETAHTVATCFKLPYSAATNPSTSDPDSALNPNDAERRNIVFLGHDTQQDVAYLSKIGYSIHNLSTLLETMDTSAFYRVFAQEPNPRNLGHVCMLLDIDAWHLHNAGNDAVYTLQAMLGLCVKDAVENRGSGRGVVELERERKVEEEVAKAKEEAENRVREQAAEWKAVQADEGDGGVADLFQGLKFTAGGRVLDV